MSFMDYCPMCGQKHLNPPGEIPSQSTCLWLLADHARETLARYKRRAARK